MKLNHIFILILGLLVFVACKKDKLEGTKSILTGTWNWTETYEVNNHCANDSLWNYNLIDEQGPGNTFSLEFLEKGKVMFSHNDGEIWEKRIVFDLEESINNGPYEYHFIMLLNNESDNDLEVWVGPDSLLVHDYPKDTDVSCTEMFNHFTRE